MGTMPPTPILQTWILRIRENTCLRPHSWNQVPNWPLFYAHLLLFNPLDLAVEGLALTQAMTEAK